MCNRIYQNAVFIGYGPEHVPRYAAIRSTKSAYKGEATGSDKHFSFSIADPGDSGHLHLFESAIDLLSFATIQLEEGRDWKQDAFLSLAGVFPYKREGPARCTGAISERSFWNQRNPASSGH